MPACLVAAFAMAVVVTAAVLWALSLPGGIASFLTIFPLAGSCRCEPVPVFEDNP
jgi:hypothetical protein